MGHVPSSVPAPSPEQTMRPEYTHPKRHWIGRDSYSTLQSLSSRDCSSGFSLMSESDFKSLLLVEVVGFVLCQSGVQLDQGRLPECDRGWVCQGAKTPKQGVTKMDGSWWQSIWYLAGTTWGHTWSHLPCAGP